MRLHLPKGLLHAVLTALVTTSAALVTLGSSAHAGIAGSTFYLNGSSADVEGDNATYCTWDSGSVYTSISTDPEGVSTVIGTIAAGDISTATINTLYLPNEKALTISAGGNRGFTEGDGLIIKDVQIAGDNGTATMTIAASQIVTLGAVSGGKLNVEFTGGDNYNRKLQIKDSSTISLGTIKNSWGLDAIDIEAGSQLSADTISFKSGDNGNGVGQGGKITGGGKVKVTTFETGNVGNYTVSVENFEATAINAACKSDRTLTLSSANLTVGTLTQTQGKVVLNSANATIDRLVLSGGSLTNNGTLTITGSFSGATIAQGAQGSLVLDGAVINLDGLTEVTSATWDEASEGWQAAANTSEYKLTDGGGIQNKNAEFRVGGSGFSNATISDTGVVSIKAARYNILANGTASISDIAASASEEQIATNGYYINVLEGGTLTGVSGVLSVGVKGAGTIQTGGEIQFDDRFITFTGTIELGAGGMKSSNKGFTSSNNLVLTADSKITSMRDTVNAVNGVISGAYGLTIAGEGITILTAANTLSGKITVASGATLKLSSGRNNLSGSGLVTVENDAVFDLNGRNSSVVLPTVTLSGGILRNSGNDVDTGSKQLDGIQLTANSVIDSTKRFGLVRNGYDSATLSLGVHTLTKIGSAQFDAVSTAITGTGTLRLEKGNFNLESKEDKTASSLGDGVNVELAGGSLIGSFVNDGTSSIHGVENGIVSASITNNGTLKVTSAGDKTVSFTGAIKSGADDASLVIEGTAKLTAQLNTETVKNISVLNGGSLILDGNRANGDYSGIVTVDVGGKLQSINNEQDQLVNGDSGKLILNGEFTIEGGNANSRVNGISGSGIVKTAQTVTLNMDSENSFTGSVVSSGGTDRSVILAFSEGTTVSLKSLSATNGSTLNAKGIAAVTDTTGGLSVSELVIGAGSKVQVWGTGDTWTESTEATVLMKGSDGSPVTLTVGTGTGTGASTLNANLVLDGATVTLNNALAMGSDLTLNNITLSMSGLLGGHIASGDTIELFTGVDSLTLGADPASGDVITVGANVDASDYFTNLGQGDFLLTYTGSVDGGIVALVAQRDVPEPTTATLSLLALMGLAARRRRRKA